MLFCCRLEMVSKVHFKYNCHVTHTVTKIKNLLWFLLCFYTFSSKLSSKIQQLKQVQNLPGINSNVATLYYLSLFYSVPFYKSSFSAPYTVEPKLISFIIPRFMTCNNRLQNRLDSGVKT